MITTSSWSKLASSTSSAPLQVHQGRGNPLNIVSLHCLTFLYYYLLIPPALLITVLFHVCPRGLVSFRVEEGGPLADIKVFELQEVLDFIQARGEPDYS